MFTTRPCTCGRARPSPRWRTRSSAWSARHRGRRPGVRQCGSAKTCPGGHRTFSAGNTRPTNPQGRRYLRRRRSSSSPTCCVGSAVRERSACDGRSPVPAGYVSSVVSQSSPSTHLSADNFPLSIPTRSRPRGRARPATSPPPGAPRRARLPRRSAPRCVGHPLADTRRRARRHRLRSRTRDSCAGCTRPGRTTCRSRAGSRWRLRGSS